MNHRAGDVEKGEPAGAPLERWLARRHRSSGVILAAFAGVITSFALAPYGVWPLGLVGLFAAILLLRAAQTPVQACLIGWSYATAYFCIGLSWITQPFQVDAARHAWMAPFALVFMAAGLGMFWALAFGLAHRLAGTRAGRTGMVVLTLASVELARGYILTGFPWAGVSQFWVDSGTALWLAWVGPHGLTGLTLVCVALPVLALFERKSTGSLFLGLLPLIALVGGGAVLQHGQGPAEMTDKVVRIVQPNARQDQKWDPAMSAVFFDRQIGFTRARPAPDQPEPDLIVWPETALTSLLHNSGPAFDVISDAAQDVPVVVGVQRREGGRYYNSMAVIGPQAQVRAVHDKHHLVPFGEYIPLGDLAAQAGVTGFAAQHGNGFSAGPGPDTLDFGTVGRGLPLICYEAVFARHSRAPDARPDFLIQITNDAWFGDFAGPYQHLAQARMRAIEQGLPMIRAANTGISAMIDPQGRITQSLALGTAGYIDARLPRPVPPTIYGRTGDLPVTLLLVGAFVCVMVAQRRRPHSK